MYFQGVPSSQTQRNKYGENALNLAVRAGLKGTRVFQQKKINLFEEFFQKEKPCESLRRNVYKPIR